MKRLEDYSKEELRALSQVQIEQLIDIECAHDGVPLLPKEAPVKPATTSPQPDTELFYIEGFYLVNKEDADQILNLINSSHRMKDKYYNNGYMDDDKAMTYTVKKEFSINLKNQTQAQKDVAKQITQRYEAEKSDYDRIVDKRKDVINRVNDATNEAWEEYNKIQKYKGLYARYLTLSEGEKDIAMNFLKAAVDESDHEFINTVVMDGVVNDTMLGTKVPPDTSAPLEV